MDRRKILLTVWILALAPIYFTLLVSISRSHFFADDFLWGSRFLDGPGALLNVSAYAGRPLSNNLYWYVMGLAAGHSSAVPYLMTNLSLILASYFLLYHSFRSYRAALLISFTFLSFSSSLFETVLWAANITHCLGFFFVTATICCLARLKDQGSRRRTLAYLPLISLVASLAIQSNPIFIGPAFLLVVWSLFVVFNITQFSKTYSLHALSSVLWMLLVCVFYLKSSNQFWDSFGARDPYGLSIHAIRPNIDWYWNLLVADDSFQRTLLVTAILSWVTLIVVRLSRRDRVIQVFAGPILGLSVLLPVLAQANQRSATYLLLPLAASAFVYKHEKTEKKFNSRFFVNSVQSLLVLSTVTLLFLSGSSIRSYFSGNARGQSLVLITQEVEGMRGSPICFVFESQAELQIFAAETQAGAAFLRPFGSLLSVHLSGDVSKCQNSEEILMVDRNSDYIWRISED